VTA
jgi:hypothetical protein